MPNFDYVCAASLRQAVDLLNEQGVRSRVLAGGTDLIVRARSRGVDWDRVVDVTRVPELKVIQADSCITVGAAVTFTEILTSPLIRSKAPLLAMACKDIGSVQIRNVATLGGNVANAAAAADTVPALVCLNAEAIVVTPQGERRVHMSDLIPRCHEPDLPHGSLIRAFVFEIPSPHSRMAFERIVRRQAMAIARLSLAAMGKLDSHGRIALMRLAPGAVFDHFRRIRSVEEMLLGERPCEELFAAAGRRMADVYAAEAAPRWSSEYKARALSAITERALRQVVGGQDEA